MQNRQEVGGRKLAVYFSHPTVAWDWAFLFIICAISWEAYASFFIIDFGKPLVWHTTYTLWHRPKKKKKKAQTTLGNWHRASGRVLRTNRSTYEVQGHGLTSDLRPWLSPVSQAVHGKPGTALTSYVVNAASSLTLCFSLAVNLMACRGICFQYSFWLKHFCQYSRPLLFSLGECPLKAIMMISSL